MNLLFKIKYYANRTLLTFLGPADLDEAHDPIARLDRQWEQRFGVPRGRAALVGDAQRAA